MTAPRESPRYGPGALLFSAALLAASCVVGLGDSGCAERVRQPGAPDGGGAATTGRFLALGDSFTIGTGAAPEGSFPARLTERWRAAGCALELENLGVNGYTTDDLIRLELPRLATFHPTFVTVAIGANDIVHGTSIEAYRGNVRVILDATKASGARVVVLPQPDWSRSPVAASFGAPAVLDAAITRFNAVLAEEARLHDAQWVDLVPLMREQAQGGLVASDGLHPSAPAYDAWAAELARRLAVPCAG